MKEAQKIKISRLFKYRDGTNLSFNFYGDSKDNDIDEDNIADLLNNIFKNRNTAPNLVEATKSLKTIFRKTNEKLLNIYRFKENETEETVSYFKSKLNMFSYHKTPTDQDNNTIKIDYTPEKSIKYSIENEQITKLNKNYFQETNKLLEEKFHELEQLQNLKPIILSDEAKVICTIYRLFYQQNPNFSKQEDRVKAQSMLAFLIEYDICILKSGDHYYDFNLRHNHQMVMSIDLMTTLHSLAPLGEIPKEESSIKLTNWVQKTIEPVGKEIRNEMSTKENPIAWFVNIVKISHIKKYCVPSYSTEEDIANYSNSTTESVRTSLKLVRKISDTVNKEKF